MAASSATQHSGCDYKYRALVKDIIAHPLLPLIIKKVFDVCQSNAFERSHLIPHFSEAEGNASGLQNYAEQHGLTNAWARWGSTDMFMSAMVASLNQVSSTGAGNNVALRETIAAGQTALSAVCTDPRYVGPMDSRRDPEEVQKNDHGPKDDMLHRPSAMREVVGCTQRSDQEPSSLTQTPRATNRRALSDKAKKTLEIWFQEHISVPYPTKQEKDELAALCDISLSSVNNWFGNKRMRVKRRMLQVKSQHREEDSITDKVLAPKSKWNAVVLSKIESKAGRDALESATGASVSVPPAMDGGRDEHSVLQRAGASPSIPLPTATGTEKAGESSEVIQPRRPRRRQGRPGLSTLANPGKSPVPHPSPMRENADLPKERNIFPSQSKVGLPILPRTTTITGQVREGIEVSREGQAMQSQIQLGHSFLPGTVALTGRIRDGAGVYMGGQSLPSIRTGSSALSSIAMTTEQVRNSNSVNRAGHPLPPHSLGGVQTLQTTALTEEPRNNVEARTETRAMRKRQLEDPLKLQSAAKLPVSSSSNVKPKRDLTQPAGEPIGHTTQLATAGGGPPDTGSIMQDNGEDVSSQTIGQTEQTQRESHGLQGGPSRFTRKSKRRKQAKR